MTNPTTPFSWQMPTSTDLVTDLPADFETFGQAVATSMADLLGGTTGQILSKASNTDMDFTWITNDVGDITAVTAGTGISGGGTSGAITITNDMATTITTNGDLIYGTGSGTYTRRGIGTTGQVLTVSGGVPTWATPAGGGGKVLQVVSATYSTSTTIASTTFTDSGLSVSITPSATSSKILVMVSQPTTVSRGAIGYGGVTQLVRGSTVIYKQGDTYETLETNAGSRLGAVIPMVYLDSPSTTSATTYKTQGRAYDTSSSGQIQFQNGGATSSIVVMEIGA